MQLLFFGLASVFWVSFFILIILFLRKQSYFVDYLSYTILIVIVLLCLIKLLLPFEFKYTIVYDSSFCLVKIWNFFKYEIFVINIGESRYSISVFGTFISITFFVSIILLIKCCKGYKNIYRLFNYLPSCSDNKVNSLLSETKGLLNINKELKLLYIIR